MGKARSGWILVVAAAALVLVVSLVGAGSGGTSGIELVPPLAITPTMTPPSVTPTSTPALTPTANPDPIFDDGYETGDTSRWSRTFW